MSEIENALANIREFKGYSYGIPQQKYFQPYTINSGIEDDHIPFLNRGKLFFLTKYSIIKSNINKLYIFL